MPLNASHKLNRMWFFSSFVLVLLQMYIAASAHRFNSFYLVSARKRFELLLLPRGGPLMAPYIHYTSWYSIHSAMHVTAINLTAQRFCYVYIVSNAAGKICKYMHYCTEKASLYLCCSWCSHMVLGGIAERYAVRVRSVRRVLSLSESTGFIRSCQQCKGAQRQK